MYRVRQILIGLILECMAFIMLPGSVIDSYASEPDEQKMEQDTYYLHENSNVDTIHALTQGALPCIGEARILVFYVDFKNGAENWPYTVEEVENMFFSEKGKNDATIAYSEEDSLRSVYYRSSYGKVDITGEVYEYETQYDTSYYTGLPMVLDEVIEYYRDTINWNDYDGNNDGYIDGIYLIARNKHSFGGPNMVTGYLNTVADKEICKACFLDSYDYLTMCHETCHMFGPPDMYESAGVNPSGIKTMCFMDTGYGDLPSPTKFVLGWLDDVTFVDMNNVGKHELKSYSNYGDVLVIYPNGDKTNRNWFFVEYVTPEGNNPQAEEGLRVWKTQMNLDEDYNINGAKEFCFGMPPSPYEYLESICPEGGFNYYLKTGDVLSPYTYPSTSYSDTFYMIGRAKFLKDLTFSGIEIKCSKLQNSTAEVVVNISDTPDCTKEVILKSKNYMPDKSSAFLDTGEKYHIATIDSSIEAKTMGGARLVSLDGTKSIPLDDRMAGNNRSVNLYIDKQYLIAENMTAYKLVIPTLTTYYGQAIQAPQMTEIIDLPMLPISYDEAEEVYNTDFQMSYESYLTCFRVSNEKIVTIFWDDISSKLFWGEFDLEKNITSKYELEVPKQLVMNGLNEEIIVWEDDGFYYVYISGFICCYQNKSLICYLDTTTLQHYYDFCGGNENSYFVNDGNKELYHLKKQGTQLSMEKVSFISEHAYENLVPTICEQYGEVKDVYCLQENRYIINSSNVLYLVKENSVEEYDFTEQISSHNINMRTVEVVGDKIYVFHCGDELIRYELDMDFNLIETKVLLYKLEEAIWGPFTLDVEFVDDIWVLSMESVSSTNAISYPSTFVITFDKNGTVINYYRYGDATNRYVCQVVPLNRDIIVCIKAFSFFYLSRPGEHFYSVWEPDNEEQHKRSCECGDTQYANHIWNANEGKRCGICGLVEKYVTGIVLSETSISIQPGGTYTLVAGVTPDNASIKAVTWKSSDTTVATVDANGRVTAVGAGTAIITATAKDGSGKNASCTVTVIDPASEQKRLVRAFVERMYTVALGRAAEAEGLNFYVQRLLSGDSNGACIAESFLCSPEFLNKGHSDAEYVKVLYRTFFDREPAAEEVNYWVDKLSNGQTKAFVLSGFVNSYEFDNLCTSYGISRGFMREDGKPLNPGIGRFAERMYTVVLERAGEKEGIEYWSLSIANGVCTPKDAAKNFFLSPEYVNKNTSDAQYITTLYKAFMDREPEAGGVEYWQNVLKNGATREQILEGFADSAEFKGIMASFGL